MQKPLKYAFISIIIVLLSAMIIHVAVAYVNIVNDPYTSAPSGVAFFLLIPYVIAVAICCAVWAITYKIITNKIKHKADSTDKCN
ncbi:MAG: hypothetical protein K2M64_02950 [Clostridia bacterium]|nr:hypothetical protein [Clostridia bacterium]